MSFLTLAWRFFDFPQGEELILVTKNYFEIYGIPLVFASAVIESMLAVGAYVPGGVVIFLGVIFSVGDPVRVILVVLAVIVGFLIGFTIDFFLGKYGWFRFFKILGFSKSIENTKERIDKYGLSTAWLACHHPNLGALVSTAYGILQYPFRKFIFNIYPPTIAWCVFWGFIAYIFGEHVIEILGYKSVFIVLGVWILVRFVEVKLFRKKKTEESL